MAQTKKWKNSNMREMYHSGATLSELAIVFNISTTYVYTVLKELGVKKPSFRTAHFTEKEKLAVLADYKEGVTLDELAKKYGRCVSAVRYTLLKQGVSFKPPPRYKTMPKKLKDKICKLYNEGYSTYAICYKTGVSTNLVRKIVKEAGIKMRKCSYKFYKVAYRQEE